MSIKCPNELHQMNWTGRFLNCNCFVAFAINFVGPIALGQLRIWRCRNRPLSAHLTLPSPFAFCLCLCLCLCLSPFAFSLPPSPLPLHWSTSALALRESKNKLRPSFCNLALVFKKVSRNKPLTIDSHSQVDQLLLCRGTCLLWPGCK